jgi:hypothetical protein
VSKEREHEEFAAAISWVEKNLGSFIKVDRINAGDAIIGGYRVCYEGEGWSVYRSEDDDGAIEDDDMDPVSAVACVLANAVPDAMEAALIELNLDSDN